ncbi:MAG: ATP-binding cassette domain-containing protein [Anaerolineales bacterium]|nr:ATP-binding cassette domain-containing protein [Anaerolineales bacterium]
MGAKARQAKGQARVTAYEKLLGQEAEARREELDIYIPPGPRLGDLVFEFDKVTKSYGRPTDRLILDGFSASIPPGSIVGIIGPNGAGKTTLLKMITGKETSDSGTIKIGDTVKFSYVDQTRTSTPRKPSTKRSQAALKILSLANAKSTHAVMSHPSTSQAPTSKRKSASSQAENATASISPRPSPKAPTSCSSMNPPTI